MSFKTYMKDNLIRIAIGFLCNLLLLWFISPLHFVIVAIVQMFYFIVIYSIIDLVREKIKKHKSKKGNYIKLTDHVLGLEPFLNIDENFVSVDDK